ncbi:MULTISPECIES: 3'-5' exonuclease [unclassified Mesorhizobium]|uniref:3'-5' exonuclease n=1 Tax=unclassified Mesorhizobium TaxID=325217 RepID=UPI000FCA4040|nr:MULTISPECIES: 3'-5' exonuclease [unclassified Mesorhizobium]TGP22346.1 3'-5' exonuclease [Mesorhizobium sp. M1D.F.Ca.ET.231.01.1.1]TGP24684.1 3'-5' exonuclease [Mesorhizobium sp. M1D.F.Ca.ET.234.01.1.1]TGS37287.1 3'-5' exonuclease [Mesorhizobium sp. M1D.F.Ca.ET.184.01.1.1]TGS58087.1 3'-5' exonuclease [Mesorhizobium sp. M1D.F.Ca.ET.183.01.1.1]
MAEPFTLIRVTDTETTGLTDPKELVEIGWTDVRLFPTGWAIESGPHARLVNPGMPITAGAKSAHHLFDEDVADGMAPDEARGLVAAGADFIACHNLAYDGPLLKSAKPGICTFKCAKDVYPNLESHKNGAIWYALGLGGGAKQMEPVHRAGPDSWTTAHILLDLLRVLAVETMVDISANPLRLLKMTFGKHAGTPFSELPTDYIDWIVNKSDMKNDPDKEDVVHTARLEWVKRTSEPRLQAQQPPAREAEPDPDAWRKEMERGF